MERDEPEASFGAEQVAALLGLSAAQLRGYVRAGVVEPAVGPRGALRFSFQDLVFLRDVTRLTAGRVPPRRVERAVQGLRRLVPDRPLSGVRLSTLGREIVARGADGIWSAESGQFCFDFLAGPSGSRRAGEAPAPSEPRLEIVDTADGWYAFAGDLASVSPVESRAAYARALELDPALAEAHIDWGCLEHEAGHLEEAESHYRAALALRPEDPIARFDLAVVLEDQERLAEARAAYESALAADPANADAHANLARLCDRQGDGASALRHLRAYRRLTRG